MNRFKQGARQSVALGVSIPRIENKCRTLQKTRGIAGRNSGSKERISFSHFMARNTICILKLVVRNLFITIVFESKIEFLRFVDISSSACQVRAGCQFGLLRSFGPHTENQLTTRYSEAPKCGVPHCRWGRFRSGGEFL